MLTDLQKRTAQAIVNIFETGSVLGDYGKVTLLPGDSGHLTYGRSQTTLCSGLLHDLIERYCNAPGARFAKALSVYLQRLRALDTSLDHDGNLRSLLQQAGADPVMRDVQDLFFDDRYWNPAVKAASGIGIRTALGVTIVYDSYIHGSWGKIRDRTTRDHGEVVKLGDQGWIARYVDVRRTWLAGHGNQLLRKTVYRMDAFRDLIKQGKWGLELPLTVRGRVIDEAALGIGTPVHVPSPVQVPPPVQVPVGGTPPRLLRLESPMQRGEDVRALQEALARAGLAVDVDGVFGPRTRDAVVAFQRREGLAADGIVGPATRARLGI